MTSAAVLDANLAVWTVVPGPYGLTPDQIHTLVRDLGRIVVPGLWVYEVTSVLYRLTRDAGLKEADGWLERTLLALLSLPDEIVHPDAALAVRAWQWAARLGQKAAYDGFYVALAERMNLPLWTGDERLYLQAREVAPDLVHFVAGQTL